MSRWKLLISMVLLCAIFNGCKYGVHQKAFVATEDKKLIPDTTIMIKEEVGPMATQDEEEFDNSYIEYFTNYVGEINFEDSFKYYVIKQFYQVQAAISKHGHSRLIVFNNKNDSVRIIYFDTPDQMPVFIDFNYWIFA